MIIDTPRGKTSLYFGDETEKKLLGVIAVADFS